MSETGNDHVNEKARLRQILHDFFYMQNLEKKQDLKVEGKALGKWKVVWERSKEEYERVMKE
jgi:hypothetical protein